MGALNGIAEIEIARISWANYREAGGDASSIRNSLFVFLATKTPEAAHAAYWGLENHVVAQGTVYSSAEPCIAVLMAALTEPRERFIKIASFNLIYEVLNGLPDDSSAEPGNAELVDRCRERVREGLWLLIREAMTGLAESALDIIELVDEARADQVRVWLSAVP